MSRGIAILLVASLSVLTAEAVLDVLSEVSGCNDGVMSEVTSILDGDDALLKSVPAVDTAGGIVSTVGSVWGGITGESGSGLLGAVGDALGEVVSTVGSDLGGVKEESGGGLLGEVGDTVSGLVCKVGSVLGGVTGGSGGGLFGEVGGCDVVKPAIDSVASCGRLPVTEVLSAPGTDKVTDAASATAVSGAGSVLSNPRVVKVLSPVIRKLKTNKMTLWTLLKVLAVTGRLK